MAESAEKWQWVDGEQIDVSADPRIADVVAAIEGLAAGRDEGRLGAQLAEDLVQLRRACDLLELEFAHRAAAFAATDHYDLDGYINPTHWMRYECRMGYQTALNATTVGEQAAVLPQSVAAMQEGRIGFAHLALMASTAESVRISPTGDGITPVNSFDETALLRQAEKHSVGRFRKDCAHERHAADPAGYLVEHLDSVAARFLQLLPRSDGALMLKGFLDSEGGAMLRTALEPLARRQGSDDNRDRDRRLADALVELAGHHLDSGELPLRGGQRPHLQVTTTLETLQGAPGAPAGELEFSAAPIAGATVRRLACDAGVTRILLGPDSAVVDVGRALRVPSAATRRALAARDRGCVWPGCERAASWTSAHHLQHWAQGGATDLDNLVLVCYRHHWKVHEGGWQLVRGDDGGVLAVPPMPGCVPQARAPDGVLA